MLDGMYGFLKHAGFDEPLHSPITHMPIGLAAGALIFFLVAVVFKRKNLVLTARHASILAFIFVFPTILLGVFDWMHFYNATLFTPIKIKMVLAFVALVVIGAGIVLGSEIKLHTMTMTVLYVAAFACMIGLGYFGAGIVYGRGLTMKPGTTGTIGAVPSSREKRAEPAPRDSAAHHDTLKGATTGDSVASR